MGKILSAVCGSRPRRAGYHDNVEPPLVNMKCRGRLKHQSTTTGAESSSARYKLAAENIAEQIAAKIKKQLDENYQQDGPVPPLPDVFYPEYRQPPELPLLAGRNAELMVSHHGLLTRTDAIWRLPVEEDAKAFCETVQAELEGAGWRKSYSSESYLRMTRDSQTLRAYPKTARRRGQAHFAPNTPQNEPVPNGFEIGSYRLPGRYRPGMAGGLE